MWQGGHGCLEYLLDSGGGDHQHGDAGGGAVQEDGGQACARGEAYTLST